MALVSSKPLVELDTLMSNLIRAISKRTVFPEPVGAHNTTGSSAYKAYKSSNFSVNLLTQNYQYLILSQKNIHTNT